MKEKLSLTSEHKSVNKGDCFTVNWSSETPDSLFLTVDDGDSTQRYAVPDNGSKVCWSTRATKDMPVTLAGAFNGKQESVSVKVKVKGKKSGGNAKAKPGISKFQLWKEKMQARLSVSKAQFAYAWSAMKTWQKIVYAIAWALPIILIIALIVK